MFYILIWRNAESCSFRIDTFSSFGRTEKIMDITLYLIRYIRKSLLGRHFLITGTCSIKYSVRRRRRNDVKSSVLAAFECSLILFLKYIADVFTEFIVNKLGAALLHILLQLPPCLHKVIVHVLVAKVECRSITSVSLTVGELSSCLLHILPHDMLSLPCLLHHLFHSTRLCIAHGSLQPLCRIRILQSAHKLAVILHWSHSTTIASPFLLRHALLCPA